MGIRNTESLGNKSTESLATFQHPFTLSGLDGEQPPGTYRVVVDEEELLGLSFLAYRRVATMLHVPSLETSRFSSQVFTVDAEELAAAISADH